MKTILRIKHIPSTFALVQNYSEIEAISECLGKDLSDYGCLFVKELNGDFASIYGTYLRAA